MLCWWARHLTSQCLSTRVFKKGPAANWILGWEQGGVGCRVGPRDGPTSHRGGEGGWGMGKGRECRNSNDMFGHWVSRQSTEEILV